MRGGLPRFCVEPSRGSSRLLISTTGIGLRNTGLAQNKEKDMIDDEAVDMTGEEESVWEDLLEVTQLARRRGFAVVIFTPSEIGEALSADDLEDFLVEKGNDRLASI